MKIIGTDNHDRDNVSDFVWLDHIPNDDVSKAFALRVVEKLNENLGDYVGTYYKLVTDDSPLYKFEP